MKKHINIPIFIPHLGCPNQCVFCNQRTISGVSEFDISSVREQIDAVLSTVSGDTEAEIAFFGGSFTGIDRDLMISLLEIGYSYVTCGKVKSMRCSTRPDYINEEILEILKKYCVDTVELGLQSASDDVLNLTKRGHSFSDEKNAVKLITAFGIDLVGQMMIGLPGSSPFDEMKTADFIIESGAVGVRIYPTVVFHDTELKHLAECGEYTPISLEDAVTRSASVMRKFIDAGVTVLRVGLCASDNLVSDKTYFAGPNHAALGELCENKIYFEIIKEKIQPIAKEGSSVTVEIPKGALSKAIGQKKINKINLQKTFLLKDISFVENELLRPYTVTVSCR